MVKTNSFIIDYNILYFLNTIIQLSLEMLDQLILRETICRFEEGWVMITECEE